MTQAAFAPARSHRDVWPPHRHRLPLTLVGGFFYWLLFLLVLEPGNILGAVGHGGLDAGHEALRIAAAAMLGALVTPLLVYLVQRYPVAGVRRWSNLTRLAASDVALSASLVVVGCMLARPVLHEDQRPLSIALGQELMGNGPLVGFSIAAFLILAQLVGGRTRLAESAKSAPVQQWLSSVPIKTRRRTELLDLDKVDWIETQGNYLALHGSGSMWLLRETLTRFEAQIDPKQFTRIHRRTLVALDRVKGVTSAGAGDAILKLADGTTLRMSRSYRDNLTCVLEGNTKPTNIR
jgi:hypothetical protein